MTSPSDKSGIGIVQGAVGAELAWHKGDGLLPAVIQHAESQQVLMVGYMNQEAFAATLACGQVTFYSRSRQTLWRKGATSGHTLALKSWRVDCDRDAILIQAWPAGPTCHTGADSCFDCSPTAESKVSAPTLPMTSMAPTRDWQVLGELWRTIEQRAADPEASESYTRQLLAGSPARRAQKVGEEGVEVALAAVSGTDEELLGEAADLIYHLFVVLKGRGLEPENVMHVLEARRMPKSPRS